MIAKKMKENRAFCIGLFFCCWAYFATLGKYSLLYHEGHSLFLFDQYYLLEHLGKWGGITDYITAFCVQFFYIPTLGALLLSIVLLIIVLLVDGIVSRIATSSLFVTFAPSIVLCYFLGTPEYEISMITAIVINLFGIYFFVRIKKRFLRYAYALLAVLLVGYATAYFAHLFWIAVLFIEVIHWKEEGWQWTFFKVSLFSMYSISAMILLVSELFEIPFSACWSFLLQGKEFIFYFIASVACGFAANYLWSYLLLQRLPKRVFCVSSFLLTFLTLGVALYWGFNQRVAQMVYITHEVRKQNWEEVLKISDSYAGSNSLIAYYTHIALLHTGKLGTHLFSFDQSLGANGLYFTWERSRKRSEHGGELYFHLGLINEAHHWAFESLVSNGENAPQLKMLALTNLINGKKKSAAKYLGVLEKSLFYAAWAKQYAHFIGDESACKQDAFIQKKRAQMPQEDFFMNLRNLEPDLRQLLRSNPKNTFACEYLLTFYLLSNQIDRFAFTLNEFYLDKAIPILYQQALLIYLSAHPGEKEKFDKYQIEQKAIDSFHAYAQALQTHRPERGNISADFNKQFGKTYWYYIHFVSPHGSKVIND